MNMFILSSLPKPKQDTRIQIRESPFQSAFKIQTNGESKVLSDPNMYLLQFH